MKLQFDLVFGQRKKKRLGIKEMKRIETSETEQHIPHIYKYFLEPKNSLTHPNLIKNLYFVATYFLNYPSIQLSSSDPQNLMRTTSLSFRTFPSFVSVREDRESESERVRSHEEDSSSFDSAIRVIRE